ncbi:rhodanese-like domain-containing protein [Schlesneria sp. DSM 10557]|uniref:MBL fold metallo-hydrolase n=1 Tax=Schlesneria sp. DSM 10557 TaxID=3044399 RepID=UPI0035A0C6DF
MLLKYFYDKSLAHASYMVGCQRTGEAIVIDPGRNVEPYLEAAAAEGLRITGSAETHIHADFVSGSRELADRVGAKLYLSDEGPADWKYQFADQHNSQLVKDGDVIRVGKVKLEVLHTPGHTPEHVSYVLTDEGGGANVPMGIFTGDFVFVGSIGRPDLLETAAGVKGSAETGARQLYHSMRKFLDLPDHLQVWPAHGAGSACGKGLGAIPSSTVGYERLFNPALQFKDEQKFVNYILADQPETPFYFAVMKRVNKEGPELVRNLTPVKSPASDLLPKIALSGQTIDVAPSAEFAAGHVPGTINIPLNMLAQWAGFIVDYEKPLHLVAQPSALPEVLNRLRSIGINNVCGSFDAAAVKAAGLRTESYRSETPDKLKERIASGEVKLLDVRAATEFQEGHIAGAEHRFLGKLLSEIETIDRTRPVVAQCQAGGRSAIATSILQRAGFDVTNMSGGYNAWLGAGLPVTRLN